MICKENEHDFKLAQHQHPNGNWADECLVYICSKCGDSKKHYVNLD